jgi:hypothetical protein
MLFLVVKSTAPLFASFLCAWLTIFSLFVPWSRPNFEIDETDYEMSLPVTFGLFVAFSNQNSDERSGPFLQAANLAILFLLLSTVLSFISILVSLLRCLKLNDVFFEGQNLILVSCISFNLLAVGSYISITVSHMNGGYYINGIWLNITTVLTGLLCSLISMIADTEMKRLAYDARLLQSQERRQTSLYMSIDQG